MFEVTIKKTFSAAHILKEIGGKCEDLHGHNFIVEVTVKGEALNKEDILIDFRDLKGWTDEILEAFDHKYLNEIEVFRGTNPSSERIARYIHDRLADMMKPTNLSVARVTVWESENARVAYYNE
ncbi:MAG: 6-carboxytetrahydropterin synthase QueD [Deltaproteobacteria bacterium HGW-Deltaproteobacteria-9]|nr:MAG: 6-carboxytetrahydropterin synthase QueD [Deltaproteobacteria bacterium HGW-Deltaproteobacteria-9]